MVGFFNYSPLQALWVKHFHSCKELTSWSETITS